MMELGSWDGPKVERRPGGVVRGDAGTFDGTAARRRLVRIPVPDRPESLARDPLHAGYRGVMPKPPYRVRPETAILTRGYDPHLSVGSARPPVYRTSTFVFSSPEAAERAFAIALGKIQATEDEDVDLIYARLSHPNAEILEDQLVPLERGAKCAAVFNSGMAAIATCCFAFLPRGAALLHTTPLYGGTQHLVHELLEPLGFTAVGVSAGDRDALARAAASLPDLKLVFVETPANPTMRMSDIAHAVEVARAHPAQPLVAVDNTFLGPTFQHPLELGADLVVYSATKFLGGAARLALEADVGGPLPLRIGNIHQPRVRRLHRRDHAQWAETPDVVLVDGLDVLDAVTGRACLRGIGQGGMVEGVEGHLDTGVADGVDPNLPPQSVQQADDAIQLARCVVGYTGDRRVVDIRGQHGRGVRLDHTVDHQLDGADLEALVGADPVADGLEPLGVGLGESWRDRQRRGTHAATARPRRAPLSRARTRPRCRWRSGCWSHPGCAARYRGQRAPLLRPGRLRHGLADEPLSGLLEQAVGLPRRIPSA